MSFTSVKWIFTFGQSQATVSRFLHVFMVS